MKKIYKGYVSENSYGPEIMIQVGDILEETEHCFVIEWQPNYNGSRPYKEGLIKMKWDITSYSFSEKEMRAKIQDELDKRIQKSKENLEKYIGLAMSNKKLL